MKNKTQSSSFNFSLLYFASNSNLSGGNSVNTDDAIRVSSKESSSIRRPLKGSTVGSTSLSRNLIEVSRSQSIYNNLGLKIPNLDLLISCSTQPVTVGGEAKGVDDLTSIKRVKTLALVQVPKHSSSVLSSRSTEGSIGGNAYGIKVSGVSDEVIAKLAVGQRPNLYETVPSTRDDEGNLNGRGETNAGNPLGMSLTIRTSINGVLALSKSVPKLDGLITRSRNDLTVVYGEGNGEDILGVSNETTGGLSGVDLPKTEGSVPGSRKTELSIGGDDNVGNEVVVSAKSTTSVSVCVLLRILGDGGLVGEGPYHDGLITRRGKYEVGVLRGGSDGGYPVTMSLKGSAKCQLFCHFDSLFR